MSQSGLTARDVADYFLASVDEDAGDNLTNLKLQKLVYYAQGCHLALTGRPLFDDQIQAWQYGPAVPGLYREFRQHRSEPIPPSEANIDWSKYSEEVREILDDVQRVYGQFSASRLVDLTHGEPPYRLTPINQTIELDLIKEYFLTQLIDE